ncbi:hypothetical protein T4D_11406 [Trichinella pseudospiralis]|uniref:Uncharacterized protein n=1 Tax=Trichinella pseudospiralis TaxID=6337 RepID=A0A0V1FIL1_TRIPS|nr:hypothetical protein T4D_11406 [Trichinella pseudospiralis]
MPLDQPPALPLIAFQPRSTAPTSHYIACCTFSTWTVARLLLFHLLPLLRRKKYDDESREKIFSQHFSLQ